jgi:CDP-diacylglycerol--glycerol-3-phosphate 3-phosphatidyltransferase
VQTQDAKNFQFLPARFDAGVTRAACAAASVFVRLGWSANAMTVLSLFAAAAGGVCFALGRPFPASAAILVCGILDGLDGKVAAATGTASAFGAILDSTLDRYAEAFLFLGLAVFFRRRWILWLALAALVGAFMVSYTRARAEGLGFDGRAGMMRRAERFLLLGLAAFIGSLAPVFDEAMIAALGAIALFSNITAAQRAARVRSAEKAALRAKEPPHG